MKKLVLPIYTCVCVCVCVCLCVCVCVFVHLSLSGIMIKKKVYTRKQNYATFFIIF